MHFINKNPLTLTPIKEAAELGTYPASVIVPYTVGAGRYLKWQIKFNSAIHETLDPTPI